MNADRIKRIVEQHDYDQHQLEVVVDGELVVLQGPPGLFLYNRTTGHAFRLEADNDTSVTVHAI